MFRSETGHPPATVTRNRAPGLSSRRRMRAKVLVVAALTGDAAERTLAWVGGPPVILRAAKVVGNVGERLAAVDVLNGPAQLLNIITTPTPTATCLDNIRAINFVVTSLISLGSRAHKRRTPAPERCSNARRACWMCRSKRPGPRGATTSRNGRNRYGHHRPQEPLPPAGPGRAPILICRRRRRVGGPWLRRVYRTLGRRAVSFLQVCYTDWTSSWYVSLMTNRSPATDHPDRRGWATTWTSVILVLQS